mgnify:CR=1 FL=1
MEYISRAMDFISLDTVDKVPRPVLATFAGIGTLWLGLKVVSYMRLLLSLFIFSGKSVCSLSFGQIASSCINKLMLTLFVAP